MNDKQRIIDRDWNGKQLALWREQNKCDCHAAAQRLRVSISTLYKYEAGYTPPLETAHKIVSMTRGQIRYRDIYRSFLPEYA